MLTTINYNNIAVISTPGTRGEKRLLLVHILTGGPSSAVEVVASCLGRLLSWLSARHKRPQPSYRIDGQAGFVGDCPLSPPLRARQLLQVALALGTSVRTYSALVCTAQLTVPARVTCRMTRRSQLDHSAGIALIRSTSITIDEPREITALYRLP